MMKVAATGSCLSRSACVFALFATASLCVDPSIVEAAAPNIVMIVSDDQAWTDFGFMGHPQIRTPHLDKLAAESLTFRRGYVPASLCSPSLATMLTGRFPHQHRITGNDPPTPRKPRNSPEYQQAFRDGREAMNRIMDDTPTLPRWLGAVGYRSLQTGKWWQGDFRRGGFTEGMTKGERHGDDGLRIGRESLEPISKFLTECRDANKPAFVWYAPMLPHTPHNPPERLLKAAEAMAPSPTVAKYWANIVWFDETIGRLMGDLDRLGIAENTVVAFVVDNGWIQDPDQVNKFAPKSKQSPYDGGLRTPIMLRWPGRIKPQMSDVPVSSIDLAPTLLSLAGAKGSDDLPGVNLLDSAAVEARSFIPGACFTHDIADLAAPAKSLRWRWGVSGKWKLIVPNPAQEPGDAVQLYDLDSDPHELRNLATSRPDDVERMKARLDAWWPGT